MDSEAKFSHCVFAIVYTVSVEESTKSRDATNLTIFSQKVTLAQLFKHSFLETS